jgi:uncharacterized protein (DUF2147 family)
MPFIFRTLLPLALALASAAAAAQPAAPFGAADPRGRWITASGNLEVELAPCGAALCGTVTRVIANRSMRPEGGAMAPVDTRPALGMVLLSDLRPDEGEGPPTAWRGQIYNRENGKTYRCRLQVDTASTAQGELVLRGYVGIPLFGQTQRWLRAPE